jgi:hypothetical protein
MMLRIDIHCWFAMMAIMNPKWPSKYKYPPMSPGLTLEGDSGEEVALWLLTLLCTSAKREAEVAL